MSETRDFKQTPITRPSRLKPAAVMIAACKHSTFNRDAAGTSAAADIAPALCVCRAQMLSPSQLTRPQHDSLLKGAVQLRQ